MGMVVKQSRIFQIQGEIESLSRMAILAFNKCLSKDPTEKELGAKQCEMLKDSLLRLAAKLKVLSLQAYQKAKKEIETLFKRLQIGCVVGSQTRTSIIREIAY